MLKLGELRKNCRDCRSCRNVYFARKLGWRTQANCESMMMLSNFTENRFNSAIGQVAEKEDCEALSVFLGPTWT